MFKYATCSDIRLGTNGDYDGVHVPYVINQYMVGGLECMNAGIHSKFADSVDEILADLRYNEMNANQSLDRYLDEDEEVWQLTIEED